MNSAVVPLKYQNQINNTIWPDTIEKINKLINKEVIFPMAKTLPLDLSSLPVNGMNYSIFSISHSPETKMVYEFYRRVSKYLMSVGKNYILFEYNLNFSVPSAPETTN
jgi:hypothetical protein